MKKKFKQFGDITKDIVIKAAANSTEVAKKAGAAIKSGFDASSELSKKNN